MSSEYHLIHYSLLNIKLKGLASVSIEGVQHDHNFDTLLFLTDFPICGVVGTLVLINIINMIPEDDILCLLLIQAIKDDEERRNLFRESLTIAERRLRSGKIRRGALLPMANG